MNTIDLITKNWDRLISKLGPSKKNTIGLTLRNLQENLINLNVRYIEYFDIEKEIYALDQNKQKLSSKSKSLSTLQLNLVNKLEAFHQQVYSTLSSLIQVLVHLGEKDIPIDSVSKFLDFVDRKIPYKSTLKTHIYNLKMSIDFRAKYIDHPQQHKLHNWMTYSYEDEFYVIYYISNSNKVYFRGEPYDPLDPEFVPPVDCDNNFYVSPNKIRIFKSLNYLCNELLELE